MKIGRFNVTVEDKNGNPIPDEKLSKTVINNEDYYRKMKIINKKLKEEYHFDKVY